jgi:PAS domain S-box-containing protein
MSSPSEESYSDDPINLACYTKHADILRQFEAIVGQLPLSIVMTDAHGRIEYVNPTFSRLTGYSPHEVIGQKPSILKSGHQDDAFYQELWGTIRAGRSWEGEFLNKKKSGDLYWEWARIVPIFASDSITHFVAIKENITQRKWRELQGLACHQLRQAVWMMRDVEDTHRVVRAVREGLEILELPFEDYSINLVDPADPHKISVYTLNSEGGLNCEPASQDEQQTILDKWRGQQPVYRGDLSAANGSSQQPKHSLLDIPFSHGLLTIKSPLPAAFSDSHILALQQLVEVLSEGFRRLEDLQRLDTQGKQLLQAQKMEAIGLLAGGVAHDFNNLITVISGYSQVLLQSPGLDEEMHQGLEEISKAGDLASGLVRQLLTFSRRQSIKPEVLDCNRVITDIETMLRRLIGEDIDLEAALDPQLGLVCIDPGQLEQILVNLAVNARDAMQDGGRLAIQSAPLLIENDNAWGLTSGQYVCLSVSDTGAGMDQAVVDRIFEPFFTTKASSQGTGLGLSTVYGIVKQNNGHVAVKSHPGLGSRFDIYLPQTGLSAALSKAKAKAKAAVYQATNKTIINMPTVQKKSSRPPRVSIAFGGRLLIALEAIYTL